MREATTFSRILEMKLRFEIGRKSLRSSVSRTSARVELAMISLLSPLILNIENVHSLIYYHVKLAWARRLHLIVIIIVIIDMVCTIIILSPFTAPHRTLSLAHALPPPSNKILIPLLLSKSLPLPLFFTLTTSIISNSFTATNHPYSCIRCPSHLHLPPLTTSSTWWIHRSKRSCSNILNQERNKKTNQFEYMYICLYNKSTDYYIKDYIVCRHFFIAT